MVRGVHRPAIAPGPKVLAVLPEGEIGGCTYVRLTGPLSVLRERGYPVDWAPYNVVREMARRGMGASSYDLYVFPRAGDLPDGSLAGLFQSLRAAGKIVVYETDDDYTNQYRKVIDADAITPLKHVDCLTVSAPGLREQYRKYTDKPIYILENTINFSFWDSVNVERAVEGLTVGIVGTSTHYDDWMVVKDALYQIGAEYPQVSFVLGGFLPDYLTGLPRLYFIPPVRITDYPKMTGQIDIGLCPVNDDPFNLSKSAIKCLEYWASRACVVASDHPIYRRVMDTDRGFLATTTEDWYNAIKAYIEDEDLRLWHSASGRDWVETERNMEVNASHWWNLYSDLFFSK